MPKIRLYHGCATHFDVFDGRFAERGSEPNSALGIHLIEDPGMAAEYAEMSRRDWGAAEPTVLVVEADVERAVVCWKREAFFGYDIDYVDGMRSKPDAVKSLMDNLRSRFSEKRLELMDSGYDAVACDAIGDDLAGGWVVFDPAKLSIVGKMTLDEVWKIEEFPESPKGVSYEGEFSLESVPVRKI